MEELLYEEIEVIEFGRYNENIITNSIKKKIISEISLKIIVNDQELVSLLCTNQFHKELAIGFLYNEGIINSYDEISSIVYNDRMFAVFIQLKDGLIIDRQESLRSVTSGCGQCFTYINPLKKSKYQEIVCEMRVSISEISRLMTKFLEQSQIFKDVGGVHSVMLHNHSKSILVDDIGRHNCFDKITGLLLKENNIDMASQSMVFVSGRISSEIITKIIRMKVPFLISRSTPTSSALKLAKQFNVTMLGYVRGEKGNIYTGEQRLLMHE